MLQISKYTPQYMFDRVNQVRKFLGLSRKTEYKLLSKIECADISEIDKSKYWNAPKDAVKYNYVKVGKIFDNQFSREVITFLDKSGKIIQRNFRENGNNQKLRLYKYCEDKRIIDQRVFDTSRISEEIQDQKVRNIWGMWKKEFCEQQWITKLFDVYTKSGKQAMFLKTKRATHLNDEGSLKKITFTEYAPNSQNISPRKKITVSGIIEQTSKMIKLSDVQTENIKITMEDEFLPLRFLDLDTPEGLTLLTKYLINKKGLKPLNISIIPDSKKVAKNSEACFSCETREIHFSPKVLNRYVLTLVNTVAHEVEHAWQHCQIGRLGKGKCKYEFEAYRKFGAIDNFEDRNEALKYLIAHENYPHISENEDLSRNADYMNNYLEVKARLAGVRFANEFRRARDNFEFFEQFE